MKKAYSISLFIVIFFFNSHAQINSLSVGIAGGLGEAKGNSPSQTSFILNGFIEISPSFWNDIDFRFDYSYMRKLEYLFPDNNIEKYYPIMQAISFKIIFRQILSKVVLLEEGLGPLALNDRSYSDTNEWDYGVSGWFAIGLDFKAINKLPVIISVGSHFGLTVTNTTASFNTYCLQAQYFLSN